MLTKRNFEETIRRHRCLQGARRGCLIHTFLPEEDEISQSVRIPPLETFDFEEKPLELPEYMCKRAEKVFSFRADYPDDSLPCLPLRYGSGIIAGMILGKIRYGANTSWIEPAGKTLDEAIQFKFEERSTIFNYAIEGLQYATERLANKAYVYLEGYHTPLELAMILRGGNFCLDLYLQPEKMHHLIRRCDEVLCKIYREIDRIVQSPNYGKLAALLWMEQCIPFLSEDAAGLISPVHYREFGIPYTEKMFERFGGGFLHAHTQAYHQMENFSSMKSLTIYNWRPDPNTMEACDILPQLSPGAQKKIVAIVISPEKIRRNIRILSEGRYFLLTFCENRRQQKDIVEFVKEHAPIV